MTEVLPVKQPVIRKTCLRLLLALAIATLLLPSIGVGVFAADTTWTQTTQADFTSGTLFRVDAAGSPGDVKLAKVGNGYLYAFRGNNTRTFWRYDIATNNWSPLADAPFYVGAGGALAYDDGNYIYALCGNGQKYFWRYDISSNAWSFLKNTPYSIYAGGALVLAGNYLYAFRGNYQSYFWRYSISANSWSLMAYTPSGVGGGGALTYNGADYIYALRGGSTANFWRYSISGNNWTSTLAGTPSIVGDGGSLAYDGGSYIYAFKGLNTVTFWRYDISANSWAAMADTRATPCVYGGGALAYDKNGGLYALRGNNQDDFWKYSVSGNSWATMHDAPAGVSWGGALAFVPAPYYASGELTSSACDTGLTSNFDNISWTAVTPAGTSIRFQIATNKDNATWSFKGPDGASGSYYTSSGVAIWAGHDGDRYIKYKAFFSTSNTSVTPVFNDVSITYNDLVTLPTASTSDATLVEETTATFHGAVTGDGGEACQYQFVYGTVSGGPYPYSTGWTGNVTTGQSFSVDIAGLFEGTKYYFVAQVKNSSGAGSGEELYLLTKPEEPVDPSFEPSSVGDTQVTIGWTKGEGAQKTMVRRKTGDFPVDRNDGVLVYFDTGTSFTDTGLEPDTTYYYRAWSQVSGSEQWSDWYQDIVVHTAPASPASPVTIGGSVYPVNKLQVLMPWLCISGVLMLITGGFAIKLVGKKSSRR